MNAAERDEYPSRRKLHPRDAASRDFSASPGRGSLNVKKYSTPSPVPLLEARYGLFFFYISRMFERRSVRAPQWWSGVAALSDRPRNSIGDFPLWSCGQLRFYLIFFNRDECEVSPRVSARNGRNGEICGALRTCAKSYPGPIALLFSSAWSQSKSDLGNSCDGGYEIKEITIATCPECTWFCLRSTHHELLCARRS